MTLCIFNDNWQQLEALTISAQSDAVQYGFGLFETIRTYQNKSLPFIDEHLKRLNDSIASLALNCAYSSEQIRAMILRLVNESEYELQRIKLLVIPDGVLVTSQELHLPDSNTMNLTSTNVRRSLAEHKTTSYMDCQLAWRNAQKQGFDDSILVDERGMVYETGRGNIFWVKDGRLYTRERDVLPGIMRQCIIALGLVDYADISIDELMRVDEVFVSNSIRGIVPVSAINNTTFDTHDVTTDLSQKLVNHIAIRVKNNTQ